MMTPDVRRPICAIMARLVKKENMKILFVLLMTLTQVLPCFAKDRNKKEPSPKLSILQKIQDKYHAVQSVEADLVQEVYQAALGRTKTSTGSLQLMKPNYVRFELHQPEASVLVSNGHRVSYYTPPISSQDKGKVIQKPAGDLNQQPLYRILTGAASFEKEFKLLKQNEAGDLTEILLEPSKAIGATRKVKLTVNKELEIIEILLMNQGDNTTRIRLQNTKLGAKLPPNLFDFKPPPGTDIVKE